MNTENIYENSSEREFLLELYSRRREDKVEEGIQAFGIITQDNSFYKITEEDGYEPHMYTQAGLCSYINSGVYKIFDRGKFKPILTEIKECEKNGTAEVRITSSPSKNIFAITSNIELSYFQIQSIYVLAINALSINFENIRIGVSSSNLNIGFETDILGFIDLLEEKLDELKEIETTTRRM